MLLKTSKKAKVECDRLLYIYMYFNLFPIKIISKITCFIFCTIRLSFN